MIINRLLEDLATDSWQSIGEMNPFPRNVELAIFSNGVDIVPLDDLCPQAIRDWLQQHGFPLDFQTPERGLNGCLFANEGGATIFIEESLSAPDRNVVLAHEFGHYLAEYEFRRQRLSRRLGPALFPILDGKRPATVAEQLGATLAQVELGAYVHFMDRTEMGTYTEPIDQVEQTANDLALELIAPWRNVLAVMKANDNWPGVPETWSRALQIQFGLPASWANPYAQRLVQEACGRRTFSEALGL